MRLINLLAFIFLLNCISKSQIVLKPHIGLSSKPFDTDSMCHFQPYLGNFDTTGYNTGDTLNDFTLFSYNGDTLNLRKELLKGKPVVLISCSYTCPVFRNKVQNINNLYAEFSDSVSFFLIYTIEAHPYPDISPYFGYVNPSQQNINQGILYPLPRTYGQRKNMVWKMDSAMTINAPVYIDGPCDTWLRNFGPAPNNAYLITTQGIVYSKHPWYNKPPKNMVNDINALFGMGGGGGGVNNGTFNYTMTGDTIVYGDPGSTLYGHGEFVNNSNDTAVILAIREIEDLPAGWASSICIDVCYPPELDTAEFYLPPGDTQSYTMYFYTDSIGGNGHIRMKFLNANVSVNSFTQNFYASTIQSGINFFENIIPKNFFLSQNYPNPFNPNTLINYNIPENISGSYSNVRLMVYDASGKIVKTLIDQKQYPGSYSVEFNGNELPSGVYFYHIVVHSDKLTAGDFTEAKRMILLK